MAQLTAPNVTQLLVVLYGGVTVVTSVIFLIVAWRAMRAHERIAAALEQRLPR